MIIGLSGYARSGKDTAADYLVKHYGYTKIGFADKLREALYELNPLVMEFRDNDRLGPQVYVQDVIRNFGWDGYKETKYGPEIRRLLQRMGTEVGRDILGQNVWVNAALGTTVDGRKIAVTDTRFPNEAQAILDRGGEVWRITRRGVGPANGHSSETSLDNWNFDRMIGNNGTIEAFLATVGRAYEAAVERKAVGHESGF